MNEELYVNTTIFSVTLFVLCVVVQNKFPDLFKENENEKTLINIEVDMSNPRQSTWLVIIVTLFLLLPFLNWTISLAYGVYVIYKGYANRNWR
ncbi:hypothetical protein I5677_09375 [Mobilitalea sibirica]|uniref:Uncharacterized protein n=1 Tax=Mobilitalea sibirica TaxID=1462919 RepID=A0A8J7H315_9FIRM|nr:hypothetical protein [Mobilitalea sibirica]MBH1941100.1 hypothetical protein [Mobilitalea sibirica]